LGFAGTDFAGMDFARVPVAVTSWRRRVTQGTNVINGRSGAGFIQKRGNHRDSVINAHGYTVAAK
jgi:hypothetical protein